MLASESAGADRELRLEDYVAGRRSRARCRRRFPPEAQKAQAVAARSYALTRKIEAQAANRRWDIATGRRVAGVPARRARAAARAAAEATAGEVLALGMDPVEAYFHAVCGGTTEGGLAGARARPPVPRARRVRAAARGRRARAGRSGSTRGSSARAAARRRGDHGRVVGADADRARGAGRDLRRARGARRCSRPTCASGSAGRACRRSRSRCSAERGAFVFDGRGRGHGAGLCQWGPPASRARGRATARSWSHYYPATEVVRGCTELLMAECDGPVDEALGLRLRAPEELIAQEPVTPRDASRLLVVHGAAPSSTAASRTSELLAPGDLLVFNDTKVIPARLVGTKPTGGKVELLLCEPLAGGLGRRWRAGGQASKPIRAGASSASTGSTRGSRRARARGSPSSARSRGRRPRGGARARRPHPAAALHPPRARRGRPRALPDDVRARRRQRRRADRRAPLHARRPRERWRARRRADRRHAPRRPGTFLPIRGDSVEAPHARRAVRGPPEAAAAIAACARGRPRRRRRDDVGPDARERVARRRGGPARDAPGSSSGRGTVRGGGRARHELPPPALDAAHARLRVRRHRAGPRRLSRRGLAAISLLQLRRRDARLPGR